MKDFVAVAQSGEKQIAFGMVTPAWSRSNTPR
jgi:hypothetical protein